MKKEGYYSSGQFAGMAHVTLRTIRYYDKQGILKPSFVNESFTLMKILRVSSKFYY